MAKQKLVCGKCGYYDTPRKETRGSFLAELLLWLCFIVPGLLYSIWRISSKVDVCRHCSSSALIPADSPLGRELMEKTGQTI